MIIINPNNSVFTFSLIPITYNVGGVYTLKLTDEQTNTLLGTFTASTITNSYDISNLTFTLLNKTYEGGFFNAEFLLNGITVFKDRIFATSQTNYTINQNSYVLPTINNNSYITI